MKDADGIDQYLTSLLSTGESVPDQVRRCAQRFHEIAIWNRFSRNERALSCPDAARKRNRLGHMGIPLWDELKTFLGDFETENGENRMFLVHCRGDRELDLEKVKMALNAKRRPERSPTAPSELRYGVVNPFTTVDQHAIQIFDEELRLPIGVPGTVMTNAGDHFWAVEFDPAELVPRLPHAKWADVTSPKVESQRDRSWGVRSPLPIGILTGNPSDSGLDLWNSLNRHIRFLLGPSSLGDVSMPKVIMTSLPSIGISMEMDVRAEPLLKALLQGVEELCGSGAKLLAHPAHTTHYFLPYLNAKATDAGARFLSMADATAAHLRNEGVREVALLGTRYVTDPESVWSVYRGVFAGMQVHVPSEEGWDKIRELGYELQQRGASSLCFNYLRDLLQKEVPSSCDHVVLAMTELSSLAKQLKPRSRQGKTLHDPIEIYGMSLARAYLGLDRD